MAILVITRGYIYSMIYPLANVYITMENHQFLMGKSTISMAIFNSFLYVYQRVDG